MVAYERFFYVCVHVKIKENCVVFYSPDFHGWERKRKQKVDKSKKINSNSFRKMRMPLTERKCDKEKFVCKIKCEQNCLVLK